MRRTSTVATVGAALTVTLTGCAGTSSDKPSSPSVSAQVGLNAAKPPTGGSGSTSVAPDKPAKVSMPDIGLDKPLAAMGVDDKGVINPPAGVVQWYNKSVVPGEKGISVIAGHVEYNGPDVFSRLDQLDKGDIVTVSYGDGSTKRFKVYAEESIGKEKLQTDGRVWGSSDTPVLALITCDGQSRVVKRHHVDNYVVWAKPV